MHQKHLLVNLHGHFGLRIDQLLLPALELREGVVRVGDLLLQVGKHLRELHRMLPLLVPEPEELLASRLQLRHFGSFIFYLGVVTIFEPLQLSFETLNLLAERRFGLLKGRLHTLHHQLDNVQVRVQLHGHLSGSREVLDLGVAELVEVSDGTIEEVAVLFVEA